MSLRTRIKCHLCDYVRNFSIQRRNLQTGARVCGQMHKAGQQESNDKQSLISMEHNRRLSFDTAGSWTQQMDLSVELSIRYGQPVPKLGVDDIGQVSLQGRRDSNEDRVDVRQLTPDILYCAVFDGHGGAQAAEVAYDRIPRLLTQALNGGDDDDQSTRDAPVPLSHALHTAFEQTEQIIEQQARTFWRRTDHYRSGTTATVLLLRDCVELCMAHVGDSRAVLLRSGRHQRLSTDHEPSDLDEKARIEAAGARIIYNSVGTARVNGRLSMTRSLGDVDLKSAGVIHQPQILEKRIKHAKDSFIVLTTDGINFVMSDAELCSHVSRCTCTHEAARSLADLALEYNADDNVSAVVVPLGAWAQATVEPNDSAAFGRQLSHDFAHRRA